MSAADRRALLAGMAALMVLAAVWFVSPWPLVALAGMLFFLLIAGAWAEHDRRAVGPTSIAEHSIVPTARTMPPPWQPTYDATVQDPR